MFDGPAQLRLDDYAAIVYGAPLPAGRPQRSQRKSRTKPKPVAPYHVIKRPGGYVCGWIKGEYALTPHLGCAMRFPSAEAAQTWKRTRGFHEFWLDRATVDALYLEATTGIPRPVEPYEPDPAYPPLTQKERAQQQAWIRGKKAAHRERTRHGRSLV